MEEIVFEADSSDLIIGQIIQDRNLRLVRKYRRGEYKIAICIPLDWTRTKDETVLGVS